MTRRLLGVSRVIACAAVVLSWSPCALARDYYVSTTGRDADPGTIVQPFLTIQKAAAVMVAGDRAYIRAGVYRESVRPVNSGAMGAPITFQPYNGESVTVSGADVIPTTSWAQFSGTIYKAPVAWDLGEGANQFFLDGKMMSEARWPNTTLDVSHPTVALAGGGSYVDGAPGLSTGTITGLDLPSRPADYWSGATIHISLLNVNYDQGAGWTWQTGSVVNASTGELSFRWNRWVLSGTNASNPQPIVPGAKNPYYLTGKLSELDAAGEWFLDSASSTAYFWTPAGDSPALHLVEAKRRQFVFDLSGRSFITVQGFNIFAGTITSDNQSQYLVLDGLNAQYVSHYSLIPGAQPSLVHVLDSGLILNGSNHVLRNSSVAFSAGNGVTVSGSGHRVFNNVIHDVDYTPTVAAPVYVAYFRPTNDYIIAWNTLYNAASSGITTSNTNSVSGRILHNVIYNHVLQLSDMGCTYTYQSDGKGSEIAYNLCHDTQANLGTGIYLDNGSSNFIVHHNVVWNVSRNSLGLNAPSTNNKIYNNTFAGGAFGLVSSNLGSGPGQLPGTELKNNIFTAPLRYTPTSPSPAPVLQNNIFTGTDPQFVDSAHGNFQLTQTSPAIGAGVTIPLYTDGFTGRAPDIGAYDHGLPAWKAGAGQGSATIETAAPSIPWLALGSVAVATVPALTTRTGTTVTVTDGAGVDRAGRVFDVTSTQIRFEIPIDTAPGVALVTVTSGNGDIYLGSAPIFDDRSNASSPTNLTATVSGSSVTLAWQAPTAGARPTAYVLEAGSRSGEADIAASDTGSPATTLVAANVPAGTYFVRVRAQTTGMTGAASNEITVVVGGTCAGPPGPPSGLVSTVSGSTVTLSWQAPNGGCPATAYIIEAGSAQGLSNLASAGTGSVATTFSATGVGSGTYFVRVKSANPAGTGPPSNEVVLTVP